MDAGADDTVEVRSAGVSAVTGRMLPGRWLLLVLSIVAVSLDSVSAPNSTPVPCTDKAANFWSEGSQYSTTKPVNNECEYTCRVLRSRFRLDTSGISECYIERGGGGISMAAWPCESGEQHLRCPCWDNRHRAREGGGLLCPGSTLSTHH